MEEIKNVNLTQLKPFKNHPFSVNFDKDFIELMKSIDKEGVIVPLLARPNPNGEGYELISGHRRKMVCEELGIEEIPVVIREMNDEQAIIAMVDINLMQREKIKLSEKAFALKMKLEAMSRQGQRSDLTSGQVDQKLKNRDVKTYGIEIEKKDNEELVFRNSENGTILTKTDKVCPNCGCPSKYELKEEKPQSVQVDKINVTSKMKKIIIGVIVAIIVCVGGGYGYKSYSEYKAEQEYIAYYNGYIDNLKKAESLMMLGGSDAESLCNLAQEVWSNAIFKKSSSTTDKYTKTKSGFVDDFNTALLLLYIDSDTTSTVSKIESNQSDVKTIMKKLQNPPDGLDKCYDTICELNTSYNTLTDMAISSSGNYTV